MLCPHCKQEMTIETVCVYRTTTPEKDNVFEEMWWCEPCDWAEDIIKEEEDEYDPDREMEGTL